MDRLILMARHIFWLEGRRPDGCTCPRLPWQHKPSCIYHMDPETKRLLGVEQEARDDQ